MHTFKDELGREWVVEVRNRTVREVRDATAGKVDLLAVFQPDFGQVLADPVRLADVLFVVCRERAKLAGINADAFADGIRGDAIETALNALLKAVADFFPSRQREMLLAALEQGRRTTDEAFPKVMELIRNPDAGNGSPSDSPGRLESSPDPLASAS